MTLTRTKDLLLVLLVGAVAFLLGRIGPAPGGESGRLAAEPAGTSPETTPEPPLLLPAQGRRSGGDKGKRTEAEPLVFEGSTGSGGAAGGFIAVTGSYGIGTSVLYLFDTQARQLAVYEARGGSRNSRRLTLVGARRIDLDLRLEGYNDESEYSRKDLRERFEKEGILGGERSAAPKGRAGK